MIATGTTAHPRAGDRRRRQTDGSRRSGWTRLVLGPDRPPRVVDGLITGWHDAGGSHLLLLEAIAGPELVAAAYREAIDNGYLWHEFGDSSLLLPTRRRSR